MKQSGKIMGVSIKGVLILLFCSFFLLNIRTSIGFDTMNTSQSIRHGETMVSAEGSFALGFFSLGSSSNQYLGIWYNKISAMTVVWVANREAPLANTSGVLKVTKNGTLVLLNDNGSIVWSSNISTSATNPVAQLLDSGNLVVKEEADNSPESFLWQSFDFPCDTFLPGMKLGKNLVTGLDRYITSWKTPDDPSRGNFTYGFDAGGYPDKVMRENSVEKFRSGPWNGKRFSGTAQLKPNPIYTYEFVFNEQEVYYWYHLKNSSILSRTAINQNGIIQRFTWIDRQNGWVLYSTAQLDNCDRYALCGAYGSCKIDSSPVCSCLEGFVPKIPKEWEMVDWSNGCVRNTPLNCSGDGFRKYSGVKLPETRRSWFNKSMNLGECEKMCAKNCSCTAYTNLDIRETGSGCLLWFGDLIDIKELNDNGQDIYIRMAASEIDHDDDVKISSTSAAKKRLLIILSSVLTIGFLFLGLALGLHFLKKKQKKEENKKRLLERSSNDKHQKEDLDLNLFGFRTIASATNNFSATNKLGEGGFGPVYKGILNNGQEMAVKRLSKNSRQGLDEFKNEVMHIAKLQHRNLVKLLGCCIEADEKMLIYEFMPNKSLDFLIFDQTQSQLLDWSMRFQIINGIARGLLYLHQDSRLRIIHRDLKAGNILLDCEMNPKISDFGLARSFGGNEIQANTEKVVGTYGYMSPEYATDGLYSVKSDVFSFGVMVLEIVSGKRNRGFYHPEHNLNLLGHAWRLHKEGRFLELITTEVRDSGNLSEMSRSIHVGLLCVQVSPEDRPSMSSVVFMLGGEGALPDPKKPGFFTERDPVEVNSSSSNEKPCSVNGLTITLVEAR